MYKKTLTDFQWYVIQQILPDMRRFKPFLHLIVNVWLIMTKSGCQFLKIADKSLLCLQVARAPGDQEGSIKKYSGRGRIVLFCTS